MSDEAVYGNGPLNPPLPVGFCACRARHGSGHSPFCERFMGNKIHEDRIAALEERILKLEHPLVTVPTALSFQERTRREIQTLTARMNEAPSLSPTTTVDEMIANVVELRIHVGEMDHPGGTMSCPAGDIYHEESDCDCGLTRLRELVGQL